MAWPASGYCVELWLPQIVTRLTSVTGTPALAAVRKRIRQPMTQEGEYDVLRAEEDDCRGDLVELAANADFGTWNLIHAGLKSLEGLLKARPKTDGKRAESDLEFALWKTLETRVDGKLDPKNSGQDQTNGNGLTSVGNYHKVFDTLIGMYPQGHKIQEWLDPQVVKWKALGKCLYDVGCFLKSHKKRSPQDCDQKLFMLWCTWEDAFPGKSFNKYHGLFCTIQEFAHKYHMTGRISEERNKGFNATLAEIKSRLRCMPSTESRINITTSRTQGNLKGNVLHEKLEISTSVKGKKRGKYKARQLRIHNRLVAGKQGERLLFNNEIYIKLVDGNLMPECWIDVYEWFAGGMVPTKWREALNKTMPENMSQREQMKETITKLL